MLQTRAINYFKGKKKGGRRRKGGPGLRVVSFRKEEEQSREVLCKRTKLWEKAWGENEKDRGRMNETKSGDYAGQVGKGDFAVRIYQKRRRKMGDWGPVDPIEGKRKGKTSSCFAERD